jgi:hypothetical protein
VGKGVAIVLGLTVGGFILGGMLAASLAGAVGFVVLLGIGVVQAAWIIPLWRHFRGRGESETAKGVLIMASIVFLLNAGCWGIVGTLTLPMH